MKSRRLGSVKDYRGRPVASRDKDSKDSLEPRTILRDEEEDMEREEGRLCCLSD